MLTTEIDPFTKAIRDYFASKISSDLADSNVGLYFDPMPITIPIEDLVGLDNHYSEQKASEFFSTKIADRPAHIINELHIGHDVSLSQLLRFQIYEGALFYRRLDLAEDLNRRNESAFEALVAQAKNDMPQLAQMSAVPAKYTPSGAVSANWCNPSVTSVWQKAIINFKNSESEASQVAEATSFKLNAQQSYLPWRKFDPIELQKIIEELKKKPPLDPFAPPYNVDPSPHWLDTRTFDIERPNNLLVKDFGAKLFQQQLTKPGTFLPTDELASNELKKIFQIGGVKNIFSDGKDGQLMQASDADEPTPILQGIKIDDFEKLKNNDYVANFFKNAALSEAAETVKGETKDRLNVSFEYQFVEIDRPWFFWPLLNNTNWYIQDARRGELTRGLEGKKFGLMSMIPRKALIVRNLSIETEFTSTDRKALNESFAIGPFRLDRDVDLQTSSLRVDAMQVIAYLDVELPVIPPRSDPKFVT